jgi:hypothetical protein
MPPTLHNGIGTAAALEQALRQRNDLPPGADDPDDQIPLADLLGLPPRTDCRPGDHHTGRPPGTLNRRTRQWVKFLESRYGNPLEVLCQIAFAHVDDLRAQLGCTALEALQEKRLCAIAAVPYFVQRQPLALQVQERRVIYLNIEAPAPGGTPIDDGDGVTFQAQLVPPSRTDSVG